MPKLSPHDKAVHYAQRHGYHWEQCEHTLTVGDDQENVHLTVVFSFHPAEFCELGYCYAYKSIDVAMITLDSFPWLEEGGRNAEQADLDREYEAGDLDWIFENIVENF